ncbi:hypothetical protein MD484_g7757, partial [Candolleomyces efflorescens]
MRTNFITTGFLVLATIAFQASAAPLISHEGLAPSAHRLSSEPARHGKRSMQLDLSQIDNRQFDFEDLERRAPQGWNNFVNAAKSAGHKAKEVITSPTAKSAFLGAATMATEYGVVPQVGKRQQHLDVKLTARELEALLELDERDLEELEDLERRIAIIPILTKFGPTVARAAYNVYKKVRRH